MPSTLHTCNQSLGQLVLVTTYLVGRHGYSSNIDILDLTTTSSSDAGGIRRAVFEVVCLGEMLGRCEESGLSQPRGRIMSAGSF